MKFNVFAILLLIILFFPDNTFGNEKWKKALGSLFMVNSAEKRIVVAERIREIDINFDSAYTYLKTGKKYTSDVKKGFFEISNKIEKLNIKNLVFIPYSYSPDQKTELRISLHGGVTRTESNGVINIINRDDSSFTKIDNIIVFPSGWIMAPWWSKTQIKNILLLLDKLKSAYNIDENRIHVYGFSDGGSGSFYFANTIPGCWASVSSFIGSARHQFENADRPSWFINGANLPVQMFNTEFDKTFSLMDIIQFAEEYKGINDRFIFHMIPDYGHSVSWLYDQDSVIEYFISHSIRKPLPDSVYFRTDFTELTNRNSWIVIDELVEPAKTAGFDFLPLLDFERQRAGGSTGSVSVIKQGNTVFLKTFRVSKLRLLISPDHFKMNEPIVIFINGIKIFIENVDKNTETLIKWFACDFDRQILFANKILIDVDNKTAVVLKKGI